MQLRSKAQKKDSYEVCWHWKTHVIIVSWRPCHWRSHIPTFSPNRPCPKPLNYHLLLLLAPIFTKPNAKTSRSWTQPIVMSQRGSEWLLERFPSSFYSSQRDSIGQKALASWNKRSGTWGESIKWSFQSFSSKMLFSVVAVSFACFFSQCLLVAFKSPFLPETSQRVTESEQQPLTTKK